MNEEPFVLFVSKRFLDKASKVFGLGFLARKPALDIFKKLGVSLTELDREQAKNAVERVGESKGINISTAQLIKGLALAFFLPTGVFLATLKKVHYRSGLETEDFIFVELLAEIPRAFRTTLFYDVWLVVPKSEKGGEKIRELVKQIVKRVDENPLSVEDWENLKPIREKLSGKLEIKGLYEDLWISILKT
ncbi:MAG: hypothetical protein QXI54_04095 [Archaeoglobaceae archaeon]